MTNLPMTRLRLTAAAALAVGAGAGIAAIPASAHATHARTAPCTRSALEAGLSRGPASLRHGAKVVHPFACDAGWATAGVITGGIEVTSVFRSQADRWVTINRTRPCARGEIPRRIRKAACDSN